jgi:ABC-type polysaccharide/polyol phosphate transport system ATPase subunit
MEQIVFNDLWGMYRIKFVVDRKPTWENFWALKGLTFKINQGEAVGIIGENGAGKSTVLKMIAGMLKPDRGHVKVLGKISGLLELGAGFQTELTGSENIYLIAGLFGSSPSQIESIYDDIVSFADIGKFINAPVKCYSQGMFVRLAFAIAINMDSDILLIDDTLAVGDEHFQKKCIRKIFELKEQGKTIVFVTHDMNMLRRICQRVIFLKDGQIIKDGPVDQVVPLYAQTSGAKEGVAILKKGPLNIVFNNGRLLFNWDGQLLTPGLGGHTILAIENKYYSSVQADWTIEKQSENKLFATGKFEQFDVTQVWELELDKDLGLKWEVGINSALDVQISECQANIMLSNSYTHWFTGIEDGMFPIIDEISKGWQSFLEGNISRKVIGTESAAALELNIPSLFFEQSGTFSSSKVQVFNSDYVNNCRLLQYKVASLNILSMFQPNLTNIFSGKISFAITDKEKYLQHLNQDFLLTCGELRLIFTNGMATLSCKGLNLTKNSHLNTSLYVDGKWYDSNSGHWEFKKEAQNKIIGYGSWAGLALKQIWEFEINNDTGFLWKVWLEVSKEVNIQQERLQFMCAGDYRHYSSDYGEGDFSDTFLETESDMLQRCIPAGTIGLTSPEKQLPDLNLFFPEKDGNFAKILNADFYHKARLLRIEKINPEEKTIRMPGRYQSFAVETKLNAARQLIKKKFSPAVEKGKLKFIFDQGRGNIFWNGQELTKKLGLYTSLRSAGRWYDSASSAVWKIEGQDNHAMRARGRWFHLAITQFWEMILQGEGVIELKVSLQVKDKIAVERLQTNLMLSERYTHWLSEKQNGTFPLFTADITDDWQQIYCVPENNKFIGVSTSTDKKKHLPKVLFSPLISNSGWFLHILNSDLYHRGRVLQYLNTQAAIMEPGEYSYAHCRISIDAKTDV